MAVERLTRLAALTAEARAIVNDLLWSRPPARPEVKLVYLLGLLTQIQALVVRLRSEAIAARVGGAAPAAEKPGDPGLLQKLAFFRAALAARTPPRGENVVPFERRRNPADRRVLHTYLARDRRSGIADRRRRKPAVRQAG